MKKYKNTIAIFIALACLVGGGVLVRDMYYFYDMQELYNSQEYMKLIEKYHTKHRAYILHNVWNAYYQSGSGELQNLETALEYYSGALRFGEDEASRYNYDFVQNLLQQKEEEASLQEQKKQEQKNTSESEEDQQADAWSSQQDANASNQAGEQKQEDAQKQSSDNAQNTDSKMQNLQSSQRGEEYILWEEDTIWEISEGEREALKQEIENLKKQQIYNQQFYGKKPEETNFWWLFEDFFGTSPDRWGEKNW